MLQEIYEYLLASYETQLVVATIKGNPIWARPILTLPSVALEITASTPRYDRIGQQVATLTLAYRGWLFARNEPELNTLLEALWTWHRTDGSAFEIAARRVACKLLETQRHEPLGDTVKEGYAHTFVVEVTC